MWDLYEDPAELISVSFTLNDPAISVFTSERPLQSHFMHGLSSVAGVVNV